MVFQFEHVDLDHGPGGKWDYRAGDRARPQAQRSQVAGRAWPTSGWNSLYWNNHDQPRVVSRFGDDGELPAWRRRRRSAPSCTCMRGTPYVYQGEELGMTNVPFAAIDDFRDIETLNHYAEAVDILGAPPDEVLAALRRTSRDNARTPMQWTDGPNGGFTTGTPWIAVNPNCLRDQRRGRASTTTTRCSPTTVRSSTCGTRSEVVASGDYELVLAEHPQVFAYTRTLGERSLLVLANLSGTEAVFDADTLPGWADAEVVLTNVRPSGPGSADIVRQSSPVGGRRPRPRVTGLARPRSDGCGMGDTTAGGSEWASTWRGRRST